MKFIYLPFTAITLMIFGLSGCASKDSIKMKHMSTIQQWKSAAHKTNTLLLKHNNVRISARLVVRYTPSGDQFLLDGFSIGKNTTDNSIDLLTPQFSKVRACSWKCYYLGDILDNSILPAQTYLTRFYNVNESDISRFYDIINRIGITILNYSADKQQLFIDNIMLNEPNSFESLATLETFILTAFKDSVTGNTDENDLTRDEKQALLTSAENLNYANNKLSYIQSPIGKTYITKSHKIAITSTSKAETYENENTDLVEAQTVCSIQENTFGKVTKIEGDEITVHLTGQVKINNDGIYVTPSPGFLLDSFAAFSYVDIDEVKVFDRKNLFKCDVGDD